MSEFVYFVLGLLFSVPVSIASASVTPRLLRAQARRGVRSASATRARLRAELARCSDFAEEPARFAVHLLGQVLWIALVVALTMVAPPAVGAIGYAACTAGASSGTSRHGVDPCATGLVGTLAGPVLTVVGAAIVAGLCARALRTCGRVADLPGFRKQVAGRLERMGRSGANLG